MRTIFRTSLVLLGLCAAQLMAQAPPVEVPLQVATTSTGSLAKAKVVFPDSYWQLDSPGVQVPQGTKILINAKTNRIETFVAAAGPAVFLPQYPLGRLCSCSHALAGSGGSSDAADTGDYRVCLDPAAVVDRQGRALPQPCLGAFPVRIRPDLPPGYWRRWRWKCASADGSPT